MARLSRYSFQGLRVLVVEDEALIAEVIRIELERAGCEVVGTVDSGAGAIEAAEYFKPALVLMDIHLKGPMDGVTAATHILAKLHVPIVYLTAHSDQATLARATAISAFGYVLKPFHVDSLMASLEIAMSRFRMEQRLFESHLTYSTILGGISESIIVTDVGDRIRFMNPAAERLTGWPLPDAEGLPSSTVLRFDGADGGQALRDVVARVLSTRAPFALGTDDYLVSRVGDRVPVVGSVAPVVDALDRFVGATVTLADVTDARRAEADLQSTAARLTAIVATVADGVMLLDAAGKILLFNPACERLFGYTAEQIVGRPVGAVFVTAPTPVFGGHGGVGVRHEYRLQDLLKSKMTVGKRRNGRTFPLELSVGTVEYDGQVGFVTVVHDLSERVQLEEALLDAAAQERRRLGRDLHDGLGQELAGLSLLVAALATSAEEMQLANAADLARAVDVMRDAMQSCRNISQGLSPVAEAQGGLAAGLRDLVRRASGPPGPIVEFAGTDAVELGLSANTTEHLYRIAQEAIANALKHAGASSIRVVLEVKAMMVRLEVCDDGVGLRAVATGDRGLGLRTMRCRADMIGAQLHIDKLPRAGTCVVCECPIAA